MSHKLKIQAFQEKFYKEYQSWFSDAALVQALGSIDQEWLDYVLSDRSGQEYAVTNEQGILLAVIGVTFPTNEHPFYVITNLATNPAYKHQGIAREVVRSVLQMHNSSEENKWRAYVAIENKTAQDFFKNIGWIQSDEISDEMFLFTK